MKFKVVNLLLVSLVFSTSVWAQKYTVSGYIKDATNGEDLISASVFDANDVQVGTVTNIYGFYSLTLPEGEYALIYQFVGFSPVEKQVNLTEDIRLNINLSPMSSTLEVVAISAERPDENVQDTDMGKAELTIETIKAIPALMGEVDVLKTLQLLPGVQSAGEGNAGFYVRGGGPDQNLVLLDGATVYNTGHLFGFFSVFNADAIKNTTLIKGGMPANYGGRLSSVVDVQMKEGNNQKFQVDGGIGLISSRLTIQGPIQKDKSSFMLSGRRFYLFDIMGPFLKGTELEGNDYAFYDLNTKFNYKFSDKDRLFVSGYFGKDVFSFTSESGNFKMDIPWGNSTLTTRWNHLFNDRLFMNVSAIYNDYNFDLRGEQLGFVFKFGSGINDITLKTDFDYFQSGNNKVKFGANYTYHTFVPTTAALESSDDNVPSIETDVTKKYGHETGLYALYDFDLNDRIRINAGLRWSAFQQVGPYDFLVDDEAGNVVDTISYGQLEPVKLYHGLEPRFSMRYLLDGTSSLKASVSSTLQYLHMVSQSSSTLPTDVWVPSSAIVEPQRGIQYAVGYFKNLADNKYEASVELYYKNLDNQLEYEQGYVPSINEEVERSFVVGQGNSYGAEFFLKKKQGKLNGWIGYTHSYTNRLFADLNNGNQFPAKFDRRHDLSIVGIYELSKRASLSATWVYATGNTTTFPSSWYVVDNQFIQNYEEVNGFRLPSYHRADIGLSIKNKPTAKLESNWVFSVYNLYNRKNLFFVFFENEGDLFEGDVSLKAKQMSIFPIIPSVAWNFKF